MNMVIMSGAYHLVGLDFGVPRRVALGSATYVDAAWKPYLVDAAVGGVILWISVTLFLVVVVGTLVAGARSARPVEMPIAEPYEDAPVPLWLDNWRPWVGVALLLIVLAYGPVLANMVATAKLNAAGLRVW